MCTVYWQRYLCLASIGMTHPRVLQILDEVEKRRAISPALVQPFMRGIMEAPFPAPGRTITVKNFLPGSGTEVRGCWTSGFSPRSQRPNPDAFADEIMSLMRLSLSFPQVIELCRPSDSRLEHVDFECLFSSLSLRLLLRVFASLLLERRIIFTADKLRWAERRVCRQTFTSRPDGAWAGGRLSRYTVAWGTRANTCAQARRHTAAALFKPVNCCGPPGSRFCFFLLLACVLLFRITRRISHQGS